jgi:uncharacterized protein (DUF433 family)
MVQVSREHIELVDGVNGPKARIVGHRIRVQDVAIWHERLGMSVDDILEQYPTISRADVHAALAYYWDHRDEIESTIARERAFAEEFRQANPGRLPDQLKRALG